jgi:hypothetical protein
MDCEQIKENISLYIDNELSQTQINEIQQHIKNCEACKYELEQMLDVVDGVKALPQIELPPNFHNEMMISIKKDSIEYTEHYTAKKLRFKEFLYKNWRIMSGISVAACFAFVIFSVSMIRMGSNEKTAQDIQKPNRNYSTAVGGAGTGNSPSIAMYDKSSSEVAKGKTTKQATEAADRTANETQMLKTENISNTDLNKKIIKTANISLKAYDFDGVMQQLKNMAEQTGGYVENSNSYIKYTDIEKNINLKAGSITLKVPSEIYDSIVTSAVGLGTVIDNSEYTEDVTSDYVDTESLLKAKKLEEERLLVIMEKAKTVEDLILLEQRLSTVRAELEVYTGKIKNWDKLVKFSTVIVSIEQVKQLEGVESAPNTLLGRMKKSFIYSMDYIKNTSADIAVWGAKILPMLIIMIGAVTLIYSLIIIYKKIKQKKI